MPTATEPSLLTFDEVTPEHPVGPVDIQEEEAPETEGNSIKYDGPPDSEPATESES